MALALCADEDQQKQKTTTAERESRGGFGKTPQSQTSQRLGAVVAALRGTGAKRFSISAGEARCYGNSSRQAVPRKSWHGGAIAP